MGMGIDMVQFGKGTGTATLEWDGTSSTKGKSREKNLRRVNPKLPKSDQPCVSHCRFAAVKSRSTRAKPVTTHTNHTCAFTPKPQGVTALWLVFIAPTHEG